MQTQMGSFGREQDILMEMPGTEIAATPGKSALDTLFRRLDPAEKESVNLNVYRCLQKLSTWKHKEEEKYGGGGERQNKASRSPRKTSSV